MHPLSLPWRSSVSSLRGFTLIELSIVLVILGLIVGGIVGGSSLIQAAKTQSIVREINGYTTAYNAFKLQYDAIPGDMRDGWAYFGGGINSTTPPSPCGTNDTGANGCNGDGDGSLDHHEGVRSFTHLQLGEIIHGSVGAYNPAFFDRPSPGTSHGDTNLHYNTPQVRGGNSSMDGWLITGPATQHQNNWFGKSGNWLQLGSFVNVGYLLDGAAITQRQASSIDKKIDDGMPVTGNVAAISGSDHVNVNNQITPPCMTGGHYGVGASYGDRFQVTQNYPGLTYNVGSNSVSCVLHFYLGN